MAQFLAYVSGYGPRILTVSITASGGSVVDSTAAGTHPSYLACSDAVCPALYAVDELNPAGALSAFTRGASGVLTPTPRVATADAAGADPCHVAVKDGRWLYVSNYSSGGVSVHELDPSDGSFSPGPAVQVLTPGAHPHQVVFDSAGRYAFVPVLGADAVFVYAAAASPAQDGRLAPHPVAPLVPLPRGSGPRHIALHERRRLAVVINELACTATAFAYDAPTGTLSAPRTVSTLPLATPVQPGFSTAHVVVSPDGRFVYGSNRGHNSIVVFSVEEADSEEGGPEAGFNLVPLQWHTGDVEAVVAAGDCGRGNPGGTSSPARALAKPRDFALSPDSAASLLVCASQLGDALTVFARNAGTGLLTATAGVELPAGTAPTCVVFPPWQ